MMEQNSIREVMRWTCLELSFTAKEQINEIREAEMDVLFTHRESGKTLTVPAFWDIETWRVRFAPTLEGLWDYRVVCYGRVDLGLNGVSGTIRCVPYTGDYAIYQHGFLKTEPNVRYFLYDDGTPFFYLGDTHWAMLAEEIDEKGPHAADIETDSHFKFIVDKRAEQKFTVYQSEPIGHRYEAENGIMAEDVLDFRRIDRYFAYIAEKGLVHANAELCFPSHQMIVRSWDNEDYLYSLTRYWVARYAAYPVLWTLGQEVDDGVNQRLPRIYEVYRRMARIINRIDPYHHPLTAHQLNAASVGTLGGIPTSIADFGYNNYHPEENTRNYTTIRKSKFYGDPAHTWWGAQWRPMVDQQYLFDIPREYWLRGEGKPTINYEARYDHLYTKNWGARVEGWISYLSGMFGYGYGAADMWCYLSTYSLNDPGFDGVEHITVEDKHIPWGKAILMPTGGQLTVLYDFFTSFAWWRLVPDFDHGTVYRGQDDDVFYAVAHDGQDAVVLYLYNRSVKAGGEIVNLDKAAAYKAQWLNPRTGEYTDVFTGVCPDGTFAVPEKPEADDMILFIKRV